MKAILIIDIPNSCYDCPCYYEDKDKCEVRNQRAIADIGIPSWCPLRPLPSNKEMKGDWENVVDVWVDGAKYGYNKCLKEITGETE